MASKHIGELNADELLELVRGGRLQDEGDLLAVLRNPFCTVEIAELAADDRRFLGADGVRERLAGFPGFAFSRAMNLLATLSWPSLLNVAQAPRTPPMVRRQAEKKLLQKLARLSLGEKIAIARRTHRALVRGLIESGDLQVLVALLDNPRLVENDILVMINTRRPPPEFFAEVARHHRWGQYYRVRRAIVECPSTPLPIALSALVLLRTQDIRDMSTRPDLPTRLRTLAAALARRKQRDASSE